jgi:hypothetical protein
MMMMEVGMYISKQFSKINTCGQVGGRSATEHECTANTGFA